MNKLFSPIQKALSPHTFDLLQAIGDTASRLGMPLYLVGGSVRDLLLGVTIKDLDLVVEGNAALLAFESAKELGGEVVTHSQFGTATVNLSEQRFDLVTARTESYPHPGALPQVDPGTINDDLRRRDFSINAMAIALSEAAVEKGSLLDPYDGKVDLERRLIRILHSNSFVDDATRVLRAIRYEQRLGFSMEDGTLNQLREAVQNRMLDTISADRLRHELELMFKEEQPHKPLRRAGELGVLSALYAPLGKASGVKALADHERELEPLAYLAALAYPLRPEEAGAFIHRLNMPNRWARIVRDTMSLREKERMVEEEGSSPSNLYQLLEHLSPTSMRTVSILATSPVVRERLSTYLDRLRHVRLSLNGHDLVSLGVPEGPLVGKVLKDLRRSRLEGKVSTKQEEIKLVRELMATADASPATRRHRR